jgi:hypothetical protein
MTSIKEITDFYSKINEKFEGPPDLVIGHNSCFQHESKDSLFSYLTNMKVSPSMLADSLQVDLVIPSTILLKEVKPVSPQIIFNDKIGMPCISDPSWKLFFDNPNIC